MSPDKGHKRLLVFSNCIAKCERSRSSHSLSVSLVDLLVLLKIVKAGKVGLIRIGRVFRMVTVKHAIFVVKATPLGFAERLTNQGFQSANVL